MLRVALTGGIGSGKSVVSETLRTHGVTVLDADEISHHLTMPKQPAVAEIAKAFGDEILTEDGALNRNQMREIIFSDAKKRACLEMILHPRVRQSLEVQAAKLDDPYVVFAIPLLVETGHHADYDRVLVVDAPDALRTRWIRERSGLSNSEIASIIDAQASREARLSIASDVLINDSSLEDLKEKVKRLHAQYLEIAAMWNK